MSNSEDNTSTNTNNNTSTNSNTNSNSDINKDLIELYFSKKTNVRNSKAEIIKIVLSTK